VLLRQVKRLGDAASWIASPSLSLIDRIFPNCVFLAVQ